MVLVELAVAVARQRGGANIGGAHLMSASVTAFSFLSVPSSAAPIAPGSLEERHTHTRAALSACWLAISRGGKARCVATLHTASVKQKLLRALNARV